MARNHIPQIMRSPRTLFTSDMGHTYVESFFDGTARWVYLRAAQDGKKRSSDPCITISQLDLQEIIVAITKDSDRCEKAKKESSRYSELDF